MNEKPTVAIYVTSCLMGLFAPSARIDNISCVQITIKQDVTYNILSTHIEKYLFF